MPTWRCRQPICRQAPGRTRGSEGAGRETNTWAQIRCRGEEIGGRRRGGGGRGGKERKRKEEGRGRGRGRGEQGAGPWTEKGGNAGAAGGGGSLGRQRKRVPLHRQGRQARGSRPASGRSKIKTTSRKKKGSGGQTQPAKTMAAQWVSAGCVPRKGNAKLGIRLQYLISG